MFSKRDVSKSFAETGRDGICEMPSIISRGLHVVGDLKSDGEIQIDGIVEGDVSGRSLTVGEDAKVIGEVVADVVVIRGTVLGPVRARRIEIAAGAKVVGELWHETLSLATGAHVDCKIRRGEGWRVESASRARRSTKPQADNCGDLPVMRWHRQQGAASSAP